jgi:hypothetical protein
MKKPRKTQIDLAIEKLDAERAVLALAIDRLRALQQGKATRKARTVAAVEKVS